MESVNIKSSIMFHEPEPLNSTSPKKVVRLVFMKELSWLDVKMIFPKKSLTKKSLTEKFSAS